MIYNKRLDAGFHHVGAVNFALACRTFRSQELALRLAGPIAALARLAQQRRMSWTRRRDYLQDFTERLDAIGTAMLVEEGIRISARGRTPHVGKTRWSASVSSWPVEFPLTSRYSSWPSRTPVSTRTHLIHSCSVGSTQPVLDAMDGLDCHFSKTRGGSFRHHPPIPSADCSLTLFHRTCPLIWQMKSFLLQL
jgi:hypothetical protein